MLTWALAALLLAFFFWHNRKPSSLPPGPWGLPLIGYIPLYTRNISEIIRNLKKEHGTIFTWKLGRLVMVGLADYNLIKKTFNMPECQGRPDILFFTAISYKDNSGIVSSVGDVWSEGRRFALRHLKDFGMGKTSMEAIIQHEAVALTKNYESTAGTPVELTWNVNVAVLNVIWKLVADHRYETDDKKIIKFNEMASENIAIAQGPLFLLGIFPGIEKYLPNFILKKWIRMGLLSKNMMAFKEFFTEIIEEHKKMLDPNDPRDYIDVYLLEIQKQKDKPDSIFKEDYLNLITTISDLFIAGSETTSSTMRWMVALLAMNPEVQTKMQKEIDSVVARDSIPSWEDRNKLPYTEAVMLEVQRFASLTPIGVFHSNTEDIQLGDYHLPKNTIIFGAAEMCHRDPAYWERPDEFYPEHFLDDQGQVLTKKEGFLPFSLGRRQCLGESLAKMELFFFGVCLLQKFFMSPPKGITISTETDRTEPILNYVKPYKVVMTKRE